MHNYRTFKDVISDEMDVYSTYLIWKIVNT